jgi:Raf kinase inhibitor-like YbhB/YbcL family protein
MRLRLALVLLLTACSAPTTTTQGTAATEASSMQITSDAFDEGGSIPADYTCDGADTSPPLAWTEAPDGVDSFALIVDDPDARGFIHWVLTGIGGEVSELPAGEGDSIGTPGRNDFGRMGWGGPCPPSGEHRYRFTLYALSEPIEIAGEADAESVRDAIRDRTLAEATLTGVYARGS